MNRPRRILIIDDDPEILHNLVAYLEDEGYIAEKASNGFYAIEIGAKSFFDVAIVDLRMPGMDGIALIMIMHASHPNLKFIIHTGSSDFKLPDDIRDLRVVSENIFIKPVGDLAKLTKEIEYLLADDKK